MSAMRIYLKARDREGCAPQRSIKESAVGADRQRHARRRRAISSGNTDLLNRYDIPIFGIQCKNDDLLGFGARYVRYGPWTSCIAPLIRDHGQSSLIGSKQVWPPQ